MDIDKLNEALGIQAEIYEMPKGSVGFIMGRHMTCWKPCNQRADESPPPAFHEGEPKEGQLDFESVLGHYDPKVCEIVIWTKGVEYAAAQIGVPKYLVEHIVKYHEWAHATHHLGLKKSAVTEEEAKGPYLMADDLYRFTDATVKEQIAQMVTVIAIRKRRVNARHELAKSTLDDMLAAFFALMRRQGAEYQLPSFVETMDIKRLEEKLGLILNMADSGVFPTPVHIAGILE